ncbi:MAG: threonylcarbamoyl-AMP synthase [Lachnospiraceae bacterium]|nr:threonylcarbamoyl-AMP synthase [Lachnospiraceae bacterium]
MKTKVMKAIGSLPEDEEVMKEAGRIIKSGGLVAVPTETVYGLAGNALDPSSSKKIYAAKGRPSDNPLIVHIADIDDLPVIARDIPEKAYSLAETFWPGPLTMVLKKTKAVPPETTGGLDTVAVRMPSDRIAHEFIKLCCPFMAAPSANASGRPSCTKASHVTEDLDGKIELVIDGGEVGIGLESTIVDLTGEKPCLLRPGFISKTDLEKVIGPVDIDPAVYNKNRPDIRPKAPGMKYRHYAPKGQLTIIEGPEENVISYISEECQKAGNKGLKCAVLAVSEDITRYNDILTIDMGSRADLRQISHNLFSALRKCDEEGAQLIFSGSFGSKGLGEAIMNRLLKAAGNRVKKV